MPKPKIGWADATRRAGSGKRYTNEQQAKKTPVAPKRDSDERTLDYNANLQPLSRLIATHPAEYTANKLPSRPSFGSGAYDHHQFTSPTQHFGHGFQYTNSYGSTAYQPQPYPDVSGDYTYGYSAYYPALQVRRAARVVGITCRAHTR